MRLALVAATKKNKRRSLSEEIMLRLRSTLRRDGNDADRPRHITALSEVVARIALDLEGVTNCPWIENRYTADQLSKGIELFIYHFSRGEITVPPTVAAAAESWPPEKRDTYPGQLGEMVTGAIISLVHRKPEPPKQQWPPGAHYPDSWRAYWQLEQDLKPRRQK
jgi:hypothetical protein